MPAIVYRKGSFDTGGPQLVGLQAANRNFLEALARDEAVDDLSCYAPERKDFEDFRSQVDRLRPPSTTLSFIPFGDQAGLARAGVLHRYDPFMASHLWQRRFVDQRLYSVAGIIHSISSQPSMAAIGNLVVAPFQPWDALICTSKAGKDAVTTLLGNWAEYLAQRLNARPAINLTLPIIPLAIDCARFDRGDAAADVRSRTRAQLGVGDDDIVVLFVGRLTFKRKTHPVPMYLALQRAQQATGARLHFVQAGQFEDAKEEDAFINRGSKVYH